MAARKSPPAPASAIVLAGGRSSRMGTDKLVLELRGRSLLQLACDAVAPVASRIIVAGPDRYELDGDVEFILEDPPFGGPVAGIAAALTLAPATGSVWLLAGDLARPGDIVATLLEHAHELADHDAVVLEDAGGWPQYLAGLYRAEALHRVASSQAGARDLSVRRFLDTLGLARVPAPERMLADVDTPDEARRQGITPAQP